MPLAPLLAAAPSLEINPIFPLWLLIPLTLAAAFTVVSLYAGQRKLVSPAAAAGITFVRLLLVLLLAALFLQPALRWTQTHTTAGTLWMLVDQSPSMQSRDPQATLAEHVRWAEGMGHLSDSARPSHPDYLDAQLTAVASTFDTLRPAAEIAAARAKESELQDVAAFASRLAAWSRDVYAVEKLMAADPEIAKSAVPDSLERVASLASSGASAAKGSATLQAASDAVNWDAMQTNLQLAQSELATAAASEDTQFFRDHAHDAALDTAAAGTSNLTRGQLAWMELTSGEKRTGASAADIFTKYHVRLAGFSDRAQAGGSLSKSDFSDALRNALAAPAQSGEAPASTEPAATGAGQSTDIAAALRFVADQIPSDESGAVVIVSDGRHNGPGDPTEIARLLAARGVRVYGLLAGSHEVSPDAAVEQVDAPEWIYQDDTLRASALIRLDGLAGKEANVEFLRGDLLLGTKTIHAMDKGAPSNQHVERVEFSDKPVADASAAAGSANTLDYKIRVQQLPGEVNTENNSASFRVAIKKDKLYALFIDDRPRWEYRYLASYLSRPESPLKAQIVLLSPAQVAGVEPSPPVKASPSNPRPEAQILPQTREEWEAFDLIVLGDVPPSALPVASQRYIASAVRDKGATLVLIAGQKYMPGAYAGMPLADLFPVTLNSQFDDAAIARDTRAGFHPGLAPEGATSVLAQLSAGDSGDNAALWSSAPEWYWHSPFTQAKPAASVLWAITSGAGAPSATPGSPRPSVESSLAAARRNVLLASLPIGIGKSLYLSSDQSWRLRQVFGQNAHDRFWGEVLRWAVGSDLPAGGKFIRFGASQPRYTQDQPVVIVVRVLHEDLTPYTGLQFAASAQALAKDEHGNPIPAPANSPHVDAPFVESPETPGYYRATLGGLSPGQWEVSLKGAEAQRLLDVDPSVTQKTLVVTVNPSMDLERRNMNTDPDLLARIAQAGGGFSVDANYADVLAQHLPAVERTQISSHEAGLFADPASTGTKISHWLFLALFALLLTTEWAIRKSAGLI
ncbi:MAG TPA: vWA domain-containing protein [Phycisphaerae bacterium]|nr:vWA domain-containing protein [Phycisphaerae bacterium]